MSSTKTNPKKPRIEFVFDDTPKIIPKIGAVPNSIKANVTGFACDDATGCLNGGTDCMVDGLHVAVGCEEGDADGDDVDARVMDEQTKQFFDFGRTLVEACNEGDIGKVQKLLNEGRVSVHDTTEEGESLLSLACSAGYFELAQVSVVPTTKLFV